MRRPLHVLLVHQLFVTGQEAGGTRHLELARHLAGRGLRVTVVAPTRSYLTGEVVGAAGERTEPAPGVTVLRSGSVGGGSGFTGRVASFASFSATSWLAGMRVADVDVVWGTSPPLFQALPAWELSLFKRVPFVLEIRDLWPDFAVELGVLRNPVLIAAARFCERFLYRVADRVVVNSPGFVEHVVARGAPSARVVVIPNGVDTTPFDPSARGEAIRRELGAEARDVLVVYAGAHGVPNHLDVVLEAAERLRGEPGVRFALVGGGRDRARLMERARAMDLPNVVFAEAMPKDRMPELLAAADVCVAVLRPLPMFDTTYPNKVFDYMAAGRPVVLAIDGVIRAVVEEAGAGTFVAPGSAEEMAAAILRYARDSALRERQGRAGRACVEARFRRSDQGDALAELLSALTREG
jgi:glycosyltransferase involved in cell wall biosynthesis